VSDTDISIEWLSDSVEVQELNEREQRLMEQAREEGWNRGYSAGRQLGRREGLRAATTLNTALSQRHVAEALRLLAECASQADDERPSVYWSSEP
jgi:flagellar biosynthesis/type III secretory pathway protein FliH